MKKLILLIMLLLISPTMSDDVVDEIREQRIARVQACTQAKDNYKDWIDERYRIVHQDFVARCATYMHLIYAYESGFGRSNRCVSDNNCFGIKEPTNKSVLENIDYNVTNHRFLVFNNKQDGNQVFANLYARWHMNKHIDRMVESWSMTDHYTYKQFLHEHWWGLYAYYSELKHNLNSK